MVTNYNPTNPDIKKLIHGNWNIITNSQDCDTLFPDKPILGFRRLRNFRDQLISARIDYPPQETAKPVPKPKICTRLGKCKYCPLIKKSEYSINTQKKSFRLKICLRIWREISNIIYTIQCSLCQMAYIGETGQEFTKRMYEHLSVKKQVNTCFQTLYQW